MLITGFFDFDEFFLAVDIDGFFDLKRCLNPVDIHNGRWGVAQFERPGRRKRENAI